MKWLVLALNLFGAVAYGADNNLLDAIDLDLIAMRPAKTTAIATVCECGCLDGEKCTCANCPTGKAKLTPVGTTTAKVTTKTTAKRTPQVVVVPAPAVSSYSYGYTYSSGSCANGQCGPARGLIRRGLFGRRR